MSKNPELPSIETIRHAVNLSMAITGGYDESPAIQMLRAQHAALKEPWCEKCGGAGSIRPMRALCPDCSGTRLNDYARAVLELGEAAGLGEAKEEQQ